MNWLHYLMEANLYLGIFYLCYCLLLNRETHYSLNRIYLLFSCLAAFILPTLQLGILKPATEAVVPVNYISATTVPFQQTTITVPMSSKPAFTWNDGLMYIYLIGAGIFLLMFLFKLFRLIQLAHTSGKSEQKGYHLVHVNEPNTAFSFFQYLFIGTSSASTDTIIRHELVHIRQKHSIDIIFIELLKIVNWFNPFIYLLQRSLKALHEYIADEQTASGGNGALAYSSFLVENAYGLSGTSITHSFFNYNLLKKRIIMLNQKRSGKLARLKYLLTVPICAGLLCASTLAFSKNYAWFDLAPKRAKVGNPVIPIALPLKPAANKTHASVPKINNQQNTTHKTNMVYMQDRHSVKTSKKGFKYEETGYLINGKTDYRVIITDKNGNQKEYWKSKANAEDVKMLREKYGYAFPAMKLYAKMPPPPPMPPAPPKGNMPPPPAPPVNKHQGPPPPPANKLQPPPPPPAPPTKSTVAKARGLIYTPTQLDADSSIAYNKLPVVLINGKVYDFKQPLKKGYQLMIDAKGGASVVQYNAEELPDAIKKYGPNAKNGVVFAEGVTSVTIK